MYTDRGEEVPFARKTGGLEGIIHDAGILFRSFADLKQPLIIAVLTAEQDDVPLTQLTLARAGRALCQHGWRTHSMRRKFRAYLSL